MENEARIEAARGAAQLVFKRDAGLPIFARRAEIAEALRLNQVVIVAGDTGSGKSTQLPQICLELGRGILGLIAHTQPRRIAARALAARIAEELSQPLGASVGYRVRFADRVSASTRLVLMTDGLLLAELKSDLLLRRYDTIIVDEAHERTLNVDLLLGVLHRLLPRRPDLKVIVTSATLDVERMARFFGDAPTVAISGRSHPIEVRYAAPAEDAEDPDLPLAVLEACRDIARNPGAGGRGDVLVFLPGEREIRDVGETLGRELDGEVEVLPLYSRLAWEQQRRIFERGPRRRVVLATNVAETSVTVPGISAVIDSGLARISRYSPRNRLQRLPIERVSRASAEQRKGRCGRLGPGLCLRLYSEIDFAERPEFTEPEVLRTNLAALLLRLAADGLGAAEEFPFIDAPDSRALGDGYRLLQELQALDAQRQITRLGRSMAQLPIDPKLARSLLEAKRFHSEAELLAIVSYLSVPDARMADSDGANAVPAAAALLEDPKSEFSGMVRLWRAYRKAREGTRRELRGWCKERGLSLLRLSEWEDVYGQVADRAAGVGIVPKAKPASYAGVHRALLSGFCTAVGTRGEDGAYSGPRGLRFHIFPGSPLKRRRPRWVMAANIVETSRVFARRVAEVEPVWIESAAQHLLKREFLEPDWDEDREEVVARERLSFLGLILSAGRKVNYGPIAPEESRRIFAREALVHQRLARRPDWLRANDEAILAAQRMEDRLRVRDLLRAPEYFVDFYDRVLPRQVSSAATLEYFTRNLSEAQRRDLELQPVDIFAREPDRELLAQFPESLNLPAGPEGHPGTPDAALPHLQVPVEYRFAPGDERDGATLELPLLALPNLTRDAVDAALPGLAAPRIEALLRSLPKDARRTLIPIAAAAEAFIRSAGHPCSDMRRLSDWLQESRGLPASLIHFDASAVPAHLTPQIAVLRADADGARDPQPEAAGRAQEPGRAPLGVLACGRDLRRLRRRCAAAARAELDRLARQAYPAPWRRFDADLPECAEIRVGRGCVRVWPALAASSQGLEVVFEWSREEAGRRFRRGAASLARLMLERQAKDLAKRVAADTQLALAAGPYLSNSLADALLHLAFSRACFEDAAPPRSRSAFEAAVDRGRERLHPALEDVAAAARTWFAEARAVRRLLDDPRAKSAHELATESQEHLQQLLEIGKFYDLSIEYIRYLPRYIKAEERRWQRLLARGGEPPAIGRELFEWRERARTLRAEAQAELRSPPQLDELDVWIEEYRVSLYAQELRTQGPVSAARLGARAAQIEAWLTR